MNDYFFVPMNEQQVAYWEHQRHNGMLSFVLVRGIVFGGACILIIACVDVFLWHMPVSNAFIGATFDSLFWSIAYPLLEWSSNQRRYRKTREQSEGLETAKLHAMR